MGQRYYLGILDYVIICSFLMISVIIGIISKYTSTQRKTTRDYILAGKNMSKLPVIFSIIVTLISANSMIAAPAETYKYGVKACGMYLIAIPVGIFLASVVFVPVYFQCGVSTVNEFLEMRYGKYIRFILSLFFLIQMVSYMAVALYAAVLTFSTVTDISVDISIITLGCICTTYCSFGGLKAVIWTDVFQAILMIISILTIYIFAIKDAGGISNVFLHATEGRRLEIFEFQLDFTIRYGFWVTTISGLLYGLGFYGTNQAEIQRVLSLSNVDRAKSVLRTSAIPVILMYYSCGALGFVFYSVYYGCDPVLNKHQTSIRTHDQIVPNYIVKKFGPMPGMTGLLMAGMFSASLSTISSALNSVSAVTVVDFIKPILKKHDISEGKYVCLAKIITVVYGGIFIGLTFLFKNQRSLMKLIVSITSIMEGPKLAIFLIGVLTRKACDKCVSFAVILSSILMAILVIGSLSSTYVEAPLSLSTSECSFSNSTHINDTYLSSCMTQNCTSQYVNDTPSEDTFILFKISFYWFTTIGFLLTTIFTVFAVLVSGWNRNVIPIDSKCLSPVARLWFKASKECDSSLAHSKINQNVLNCFTDFRKFNI